MIAKTREITSRFGEFKKPVPNQVKLVNQFAKPSRGFRLQFERNAFLKKWRNLTVANYSICP